MISLGKLVLLSIFGIGLPFVGIAQVALPVNPGYNPSESHDSSSIYTVGLSTGDITGNIPLASYQQLGQLHPFEYFLNISNPVFARDVTCDSWSGTCFETFSPTDAGVSLVNNYQGTKLLHSSALHNPTDSEPELADINNWILADPTGFNHPLLEEFGFYNRYRATDGSGYSVQFSPEGDPRNSLWQFTPGTPTMMDASGVQYGGFPQGWLAKDLAGNTIAINSTTGAITDSVARPLPYVTSPSIYGALSSSVNGCPNLGDPNQVATGTQNLDLPGGGGGLQHYLLCYTYVAYHTGLAVPVAPYNQYSWDSAEVFGNVPGWWWSSGPDPNWNYGTILSNSAGYMLTLQSAVLPDGTFWGFLYDAATISNQNWDISSTEAYGSLTKLIYPGGGSTSFDYACNVSAAAYDCNNPGHLVQQLGSDDQTIAFHHAVARATTDSGNGAISATTYNFNDGIYQPSSPLITTVVDTAGNATVHTFTDLFDFRGNNRHETLVSYYQGAPVGVPLKSVTTQYQTQQRLVATFGLTGDAGLENVLPTSVTTAIDGQVIKTDRYSYPVLGSLGLSVCWAVCSPLGNYGNSSPLTVSLSTPSSVSTYNSSNSLLITHAVTPMFRQNMSFNAANLLTAPSSDVAYGSGGDTMSEVHYGYDENNGSPQGVFGNPTSISRVLNTGGAPVRTSSVYTPQGMIAKAIDANGNVTNVDSFVCAGLFPTSVTTAFGSVTTLPETTLQQRDCATGAVTSTTDPNGVLTSYQYNDPLGRLTNVSSAVGTAAETHTVYSYPSRRRVNTAQDKNVKGDGVLQSSAIFDGLGRPTQQIGRDGAIVDTSYDGMGRIASVTNPHWVSSGPTDGLTSYAYDALGRTTRQCNPDNGANASCVPGLSFKRWSYNGPTVSATDEAGNTTTQTMDPLGRLVQVVEPGSLATTYSYDGLGNLSNVTQSGRAGQEVPRSRGFSYDSLSRLLTASNPETGIVCYGIWNSGLCRGGYDANGNLLYKTDASGMTISYTYDAFNRLLTKAAPDGYNTNYTYQYDARSFGIGHLSVVFGTQPGRTVTGQSFGYDALGRVNGTGRYSYLRSTWNDVTTSQYDLAGNKLQIGYPDGRVVTQRWDTGGRLASVSDATPGGTPTTYFQGMPGLPQYSPSGALQNAALGDGNVATESFQFNQRLQLCRMLASSPALPAIPNAGNLLDRRMFYASTAEANCGSAPGNNGDVWHVLEGGRSPGQQDFSYDGLNRLSTATTVGRTPATSYSHQYQYDSFGNMLLSDQLHTNLAYSIDASTNRLLLNSSDLQYYPNGSLASSPQHNYWYTAEGYLRSIDNYQTGSYLYNGFGERTLAVQNNSTAFEYVYLNGQLMADQDNSGKWTDYIYANDQKIARADSSGATSYFLADQRGTTQVELASNGSVLWQGQFTPFGQEIISGSTSNYIGQQPSDGTTMRYKVTGKERDAESGLDNFGARYYASTFGRFISPDWSSDADPVPFADLSDPQSLNLYAYVQNNPVSNIDPDGHEKCADGRKADVCVTATVDPPFEAISYNGMGYFVAHVSNVASQAVHQFLNIMSTPAGSACMRSMMMVGATAGAGVGGQVGLAGLAGGGVAVLVTEPGGLAIGGIGGALSGGALAMTACPGGAGNGGGGGGSGGGGLSGKARSKLGSLANRAGEKVRDVIRSRGGSGSNVNKAGPWADRTLGEAAEAAARGDSSAETAVKIAKQAGRLGQQY